MNNALEWLKENDNLAIKFRTMTEICDESFETYKDDYEAIWHQKPIVNLLNKQDENGLWEKEKRYYGNFTSLRYLTAFAEYGIQKDRRIDRFVEDTIRTLKLLETEGGLAGCATPLTLRALVMLNYHDQDDVKELIYKFASTQLYDGGFMCKRLLDKNPERKSCYKASIAGLLLYAECKRKNILPYNSENLVNYFIKRDVFYSSDKTSRFDDGRVGWRFVDNFFPVEPMRMGLPLIVSALSILGAGNYPAMEEAWGLIIEKEDEYGRLHLEGTLTKQPCSFGKVGQANKWMTFYSILAEKYRKV